MWEPPARDHVKTRVADGRSPLSLVPALVSSSHTNIMEYLRKFKLSKKGKFLAAIMKKKVLIQPTRWKVSKRIIREASRPWLTGRRMEAGLEDQGDTFLAREILQQMNHSYKPHQHHHHHHHQHFLHQKKSLKSVIEEAKSELDIKKLKLRQISLAAAAAAAAAYVGEDYVDFEEVNSNILSANSDYMDMY